MGDVSEISCIDDIFYKKDVRSLRELCKRWGVDVAGCRDIKDIKKLLMKHYLGQNKTGATESGGSVFMTAQLNQKKVSASLLEKFKMAEQLVSSFPEKLKGNIQQSYPNIRKQIADRQESMARGECWIIVAGEVGAGKSSTINLLLDHQILPTDALKCTSTIVEIRNSGDVRKEAICFFKDPLPDGSNKTKVMNLRDLKGMQEFKDSVSQSDDMDDNPYSRIELHFPFKTLSEGVVIVDTPGIEGGSNVDEHLQRYLTKAFGFIYVINTNTAGGVQQNRLGHLLKTVVNSCEEFSPETSLFIGNKWENIPEDNKEDVQRDIFDKLSKVYPGIKMRQVHFMSVNDCKEVSSEYNCQLKQHSVLLQKIGHLVPSCLRQGLTNHYWWLSALLSRASYIVRVTSVQHEMSQEDLEKKYENMRKHVANIEKNSEEAIKRLRDKVEYEIYKIIGEVKNVLASRKFQERLCDWRTAECPQSNRKWKMTVDEAAVKISNRITHMIDSWERDYKILSVIDKEILNVFSTEFGLLENQVSDIESCLTNSKTRKMLTNTVRAVPVKKLFAKKNRKLERTYNTLGGAVSCVGMLDTEKSELKKVFKDYDKYKEKTMANAAAIYIQTILDNKDMNTKLHKFFDRFFRDIDEAANRLPVYLQADNKLIETLRQNIDGMTQLKEKLPTMAGDCAEQLGSLDIFYINNIMEFEFDIQDLDWENRKRLGKGSFAEVYRCTVKKKGRPVALKVSLDAVSRENIHSILSEDRTMRDLRHENIVRYYGAGYIKKGEALRWIMVMELCNQCLKDYYHGEAHEHQRVPGTIPNDHPRRSLAQKYMLEHCLDISRGLAHVHEKGYTHRDMKMENILMTDKYVAKITDVGVAKATNRLVRTLDGSPAYMAPEVLLSTQNHTNKIDIYSTALIFWEMWFGADVSSDMNKEILGSGFGGDAMGELRKRMGHPKGGWRPSFRSPNKPPVELMDMIKRGWDDNPDVRPTAKELVSFFEHMLKNC